MAPWCAEKTLRNSQCEAMLAELNGFRRAGQFVDVILICSEQRVAAHKNILAAASPYFKAMFNGLFPESKQREVRLNDIDADSVAATVDFIYGGDVDITEHNVQQLMATANFLQMEHLTDMCADFMVYNMDAGNCLGFRHFAEKCNNAALREAANNYTIANFKEVVQTEEFYEMSYPELSSILAQDELYVHSDDSVLSGLLRWANHKPAERRAHLGSLLRFIHPACVSAEMVRATEWLYCDSADTRRWYRDVIDCATHLQWHVFLMDKMGRKPELQRFELGFKTGTALQPLPRPLFAVSLASHKNILYAQGGSSGRSTGESYYYNIYRNQWFKLCPLLVERSHHRSLVLNDCLYALGGTSSTRGGVTDSVECLNLTTNKADFKENMVAKRSSLGAVSHDGCLYAMGGETDRRSLYSVERYDPRCGKWQELPSLRQVNSYCTSAAIGNYIYCSEGLGNCMERLDVRAHKWELINFLQEREFYEIFAVGAQLYSVSGDAISRYDAHANEWASVYVFPEARDWDTAVGLQMVNAAY